MLRSLIIVSAIAGLCLSPAALTAQPNAAELVQSGETVGAEQRSALVIGNAAYTNAPLKNPVNDVRARSVLLHEMVHYLQDLHGRFADSRPCVRFLLREREAYAVQNRYLGRYSEPRDHGMVALTWNAAGCAFG